MVEDDDAVRSAYGGEAMRDEDQGAASGALQQAFEDLALGAGVQVGGGFVHDQDLASAWVERVHGSGQGHLLPLAAGQVAAPGEGA